MEKYRDIDDYIGSCNPDYQDLLQKIREIILKNSKGAIEKISYGMPTFYLNGNLVHFALQNKHIGFYPAPSGIIAFEDVFKAKGYKYSKGAVQFPLKEEIPFDLIIEIVKYRVSEQENIQKDNKNKK